jgi:hypothetical protein
VRVSNRASTGGRGGAGDVAEVNGELEGRQRRRRAEHPVERRPPEVAQRAQARGVERLFVLAQGDPAAGYRLQVAREHRAAKRRADLELGEQRRRAFHLDRGDRCGGGTAGGSRASASTWSRSAEQTIVACEKTRPASCIRTSQHATRFPRLRTPTVTSTGPAPGTSRK